MTENSIFYYMKCKKTLNASTFLYLSDDHLFMVLAQLGDDFIQVLCILLNTAFINFSIVMTKKK